MAKKDAVASGFTDAALTELLNSDTAKSISHREPGFAGSLLALRQWGKPGRVINFYFRNQVNGKDKRRHIGLWETASRRKVKGGIHRQTAIDRYRELGKIALECPDLKAYFDEQDATRKREEAEAARLAELEARKGTLQHLLDAYLESRAETVSHKEMVSIFRSVPDEYRRMHAKDVTPEDISKILAAYLEAPPRNGGVGTGSLTNASNGKLTTGDKLRRYLHAAFEFGGQADYDPLHRVKSGKIFGITSNPVAMIKRFDPGNACPRALTDDELRCLLAEIGGLSDIKRAFALMHVYCGGQRMRQLVMAKWEDISENSIIVSDWKGRGKTAATSRHVIPLTPRTRDILAPLYKINSSAPGPFSYDCVSFAGEAAINAIMEDMGRVVAEKCGTARFTGKAIRSTCETYLSSLKVPKEYRAWLFSHGRSGVQDKHYDLYQHLQEKRDALTLWQDYLDSLMGRADV